MASRKQAAAERAEPVPRSSRRVIKSKFSSGEWVTDEIVPSKKETNSTIGSRGKKVAKIVTVEVPPEPEADEKETSNEKSAMDEKVRNEKVSPKKETKEVEKAPSSPPKPQNEKRPLSPSKGGSLSPSKGGSLSPSKGGSLSPSKGGPLSPSKGGSLSKKLEVAKPEPSSKAVSPGTPSKEGAKEGESIVGEEGEDLPEAEVVTGDCEDSQNEEPMEGGSEEGFIQDAEEASKKRMRYSNRLKEASFATLTQWRDGIKCPHCSYIGHSATRLEQHFARVHEEDQVYKCREGDCEFECKWNREFYKHMKGHFGPPPYKCEYCEYVCDRIQFILSHRMRHTDERPYACELCNFSSRTKGNLIVHMRIHTGEKPYRCQHCGRCFAMKNTLDQHLATHREDRPFLCDTCGFSTKYQSHLLSHKRIHTGNVFHCQQPDCTYFSPRRSQLAAHMRSHLSIRSHICATCGRGFIEKSHLIRHERIHLDEKPFKCGDCEYGSTRRDKLKEHRLKHHPTGDGPPPKPQSFKPKKARTGRPLASMKAADMGLDHGHDTNGTTSIIIDGNGQQITEQDIATANLVYEYTGEDGNTLSNCVVIQAVDGQEGQFMVTKTEDNGHDDDDDDDASHEGGQQIVLYTTESVD